MSPPLDFHYLGLAFLAFALAQATVPLALKFGRRFGFMDAPDPRKIHDRPMVRCGGIGIYLAFVGGLAAAIAAASLLRNSAFLPPALAAHAGNFAFVAPRLGAILAGATFLFLVGLADDRFGLGPRLKLGAQVLSALPLVAAGITVRVFIPGEWAAALMTIAWVVLLTNAFNFLDNMNGLSCGVAAVCALNFYLVSRAGGEYFMMGAFALLAGAAAGFLPHNFPRARLFMGDGGSLFLGYMLAALSSLVTYYRAGVPTQLPVVAPLIILGVPLFDTASVMLIRWRRGLPLMKGDRNHFSHRLEALGFSRRDAVLFIWLVTLAAGLGAAGLRHLDWAGAVLALVQAGLFFLIIFFLETVGRRRMNATPREGGNDRGQDGGLDETR